MERALQALWLVAFADFLFGRLLTRVGIFMPKTPGVLAAYRLLSDLGQIAFNLSFLGGTLALAWALRLLARAGGAGARLPRLAAVAAATAAMAVLAAPAAPGPAVSLATSAVLGLAVLLLGAVAIGRARAPATRLGLGCALGANLAWYGAASAQLLAATLGLPADLAAVTPVLGSGELLALVAPVALALGVVPAPAPGRIRWLRSPGRLLSGTEGRAAALALASAAAFGAGYAAGADLGGVLAIWSLGFTLVWPAPLYAIAAGAGLYLLLRLLAGSPPERLRAVGLGLLFCAGLVLQTNQQHVLVLLAWTLLGLESLPAAANARPALPGGEPA
ncbi:hypothetical protein [Caldinitratiruptor microaerophilus]|uniref:Uncharacterized protein n=1 Tax=Caldinitratiruptor microaerophilus TaxID=671077 RepID=A0AA35CMS1_9FIRM|nr:hypothetical protein [Caldinitratiruptor microaerophilus]BDG62002.1 hypothetical protein caldi_30920 [Caldinitratiruptor microaerophilus]